MPQSLANVIIHIIFSTKDHVAFIDDAIESELQKYLATVAKSCGCLSHQIGGTANHVHVLCSLSRTTTISELVEEIKKRSSKWMKTKGPRYAKFSWQTGYGVFSVSQSQFDAVRDYIKTQRDHHRRKTFHEEFREFLDKYKIAYDERYVWD